MKWIVLWAPSRKQGFRFCTDFSAACEMSAKYSNHGTLVKCSNLKLYIPCRISFCSAETALKRQISMIHKLEQIIFSVNVIREIALLFASVRWYRFTKSIINRAEMNGVVASFSMMVFCVFDMEPASIYKWFELSIIVLFNTKFSDSNGRIWTIYTIVHRGNGDKGKMKTSPFQRISYRSFTMSQCGITIHSKSPSFALSMQCSAISNDQILAIHSIVYSKNERDER